MQIGERPHVPLERLSEEKGGVEVFSGTMEAVSSRPKMLDSGKRGDVFPPELGKFIEGRSPGEVIHIRNAENQYFILETLGIAREDIDTIKELKLLIQDNIDLEKELSLHVDPVEKGYIRMAVAFGDLAETEIFSGDFYHANTGGVNRLTFLNLLDDTVDKESLTPVPNGTWAILDGEAVHRRGHTKPKRDLNGKRYLFVCILKFEKK